MNRNRLRLQDSIILTIEASEMHYFSTLFRKQLYMFRIDLQYIIRSPNVVFTVTGICHTGYVDCLLARSGWSIHSKNNLAGSLEAESLRFQATGWPHRACIIPQAVTHSLAPEDGQNNCPKHVELIGIINKTLLLRLVGCLYYLIPFI